MTTIESVAAIPERLRGGFLAVGNFDGVHRGHAALIGRLKARAAEAGAPAVALTFDPPPAMLLRPDRAPTPLTWTERKVDLLGQAGADEVGVFHTGPWLLGLMAREFFDRIVIGAIQARGMVEGPTFGFGRDRGGDAALLGRWCEEAGLAFEIAAPTDDHGLLISSSRIRQALAEGDAAEAVRLLGRPHRLRGTVVRGAGRGRGLGFPTANLDGIDVLIPADGVYAARAVVPGRPGAVAAAVHIGPNATFGERTRQVEVHLIDFAGDLYGRAMEVDLLTRVRGTQAFDGVQALLDQIGRDVTECRRIAAAG